MKPIRCQHFLRNIQTLSAERARLRNPIPPTLDTIYQIESDVAEQQQVVGNPTRLQSPTYVQEIARRATLLVRGQDQ